LKGAIHIHSTYSDGEFTLRELRELMISAGCDFVCMTDHAESFDRAKLAVYTRECERLSDDRFRFVAGLEYTCDRRMHVLGLGVSSLVKTTDPQEVIRHIKDQGGVSVIAHPMDTMFDWIETFDALPNGVETWNSKYDGRYAPRPGTFRLLQRLQEREPRMRAFYGIDLHWRKQFRGLFNVLQASASDRNEILSALAAGDYFATKDDLELSSRGELSESLIARFERAHARSDRLRSLAKTAKKMTSRAGLTAPAPLKAYLRKLF
jgi:PHP domain-containing protein